ASSCALPGLGRAYPGRELPSLRHAVGDRPPAAASRRGTLLAARGGGVDGAGNRLWAVCVIGRIAPLLSRQSSVRPRHRFDECVAVWCLDALSRGAMACSWREVT